jgi:hypothetical protein
MDVQTDLRDSVKRNLVADVVRSFGRVRLEVTGISMLPSVWPGDIVTVSRCNTEDLAPGQIVVCSRDQEPLVVHRLARKIGNRLITRGDSLCHYDPPYLEDEVLGQVVSILRDGRSVEPFPTWWHGVACWILRRSQLSVRVLLRLKKLAWVNTVAQSAITSGS